MVRQNKGPQGIIWPNFLKRIRFLGTRLFFFKYILKLPLDIAQITHSLSIFFPYILLLYYSFKRTIRVTENMYPRFSWQRQHLTH